MDHHRLDDTGGKPPPPQTIILHSFETTQGTARPLNRRDVIPGLPSSFAKRRSHRKSRGGCARCKKRRVKCSEEKPSCSRCVHGRFSCVYPKNTIKQPSRDDLAMTLLSSIPTPTETLSSSDSNSIAAFPTMTCDSFTLQDMRFFHHFLIKAKPYLPVGNADVWAREIPQFAQHNSFLMHSFLALGSSHLGRLVADGKRFQVQALSYRVRGLDGLRKAMARRNSDWSYGDVDSMIAAGYALMFQSTHMDDGLYDWMTLLRMVLSISQSVNDAEQEQQQPSMATEFDLRPIKHFEYIAPYLHLLPPINPDLLALGLASLANLRLDLMQPASIAFYDTLENALQAHQISPQEGYLGFGKSFMFWLSLSEDEFTSYFGDSGNNGEMQLLLAYFLSIILMMLAQSVVENREGIEWSSAQHVTGMLGWLRSTLRNVPRHLKRHTRFVEMVIASALAEVQGLPWAGPLVLRLDVAKNFVWKIKEQQAAGAKADCLPGADGFD